LTKQMGGTIEIQSDYGKGTSVWVSIPCTATEIEKKRD
jgi:signal transduction histidine kinase